MLVPLFVSEKVPVPPVVGQSFAELELELVARDEPLVDAEPEEPDEGSAPLPDVVPAPEGPDEVTPPLPDVVSLPEPEVVPVPPVPRELPPLGPSPPAVPQPAATAKRAQGSQERSGIVVIEP